MAILVTKNIDFEVNTIDRDDHGRFLLIDCSIFGSKYILVNNERNKLILVSFYFLSLKNI